MSNLLTFSNKNKVFNSMAINIKRNVHEASITCLYCEITNIFKKKAKLFSF